MTAARRRLGRSAEAIAAQRLVAAGARIVDRNARTRYGEVDLIVLDGPALVFVEVKSGREGSAAGPERPALAVGRSKQRRLRRLAAGWLAEQDRLPWFEQLRFDVIGIGFDSGGRIVDYEHIRAAF